MLTRLQNASEINNNKKRLPRKKFFRDLQKRFWDKQEKKKKKNTSEINKKQRPDNTFKIIKKNASDINNK